jgi:two-component system CheB/CheR fusion protein
LVIVHFYVWRTRETYPGFGYSVLLYIGVTVGVYLLSLRGSAPSYVPVLMGNGLLVACVLLALQGVKTFFGQGRLRRRYWIALGLVELGLALFLYVSPDINIRVLLVSVFIGTICLLIARELVLRAPAQVRFSSRLTAAVIGVYGAAMVVRGFVTPLWAPIPEFFSQSSFQMAMVIAGLGAALLCTFGFIIMNSERLEHELKVTGRLLEERESYLRTILDSVQAGVMVVDRETHRIVHMNALAGDLLGVQRQNVIDQVCHGCVCPAQKGACPVSDLGLTVQNDESEMVHTTGRRIPVIKSVVAVTINGRTCLLESFVDITDRKRAGEDLQRAHDQLEQKVQARTAELEQSRQRYRDLAELLPEAVFEVDTNGRLVYVNIQALPTFGYAKEELEGGPYDQVIAPQDRERLAVDAARLLNGQGRGGGEYLGRRKDGSEVPIFIRAATMKRQGVVYGFRGVVIDLTEPKRAEEALKQSEEKYRRLFENSRDAIFIATPKGRILEGNAAFFDLLGADRNDVGIVKTGDIFVDPRQRRRFLKEFNETGSVKDFEMKIKKKDRSIADCLITASKTYSAEGIEIVSEGIIRDITERKRLEREVLEISTAERLEIGQDLHDNLGQHLTGIALKLKSMSQALAKKSLPEAGEGERLTDLVNQAIGRVRDLARGLVLIDFEAGGICPAIRELVKRVRNITGVSCLVRFTPEEINVGITTATELYRIAQEAVLNAVRHSQAKHIEIRLIQANGITTLRVQDDGIGIPPAHLNREGLGLRLMKYRAQLINGSLDIRNGPSGGTTVECVLEEK